MAGNDIDKALSPWLYTNEGAPPPTVAETRLQSTGSPDGSIHLTPELLRTAADRLTALRAEAAADVNKSLAETDGVTAGPNLRINEAIDHVHDRWVDKLAHLLGDMDERSGRLRKAADEWSETEQANAKAFRDRT